MDREIIFYHKPDCHLCDRMVEDLNAFLTETKLLSAVKVIRRDIEDDADWYDRYREYVPVLVVNDEEVCHYFLDKEDLREALRLT